MKYLLLMAIFFGFGGPLVADRLAVKARVEHISTPSASTRWDENEIEASYIQHSVATKPDKPVFKADPLNLLLVIESNNRYLTLLDGGKSEPIHRFSTRSFLQGEPVFDSSGRYAYFTTHDGWASKFDIYQLKMVAEIRAGISASDMAISSDDRFVIVGNSTPNTLVILDARNLSLVKIIPVMDKRGKSSRVSAVHDARSRNSFIAALKDSPEIQEINYENPPPAGFGKWVHDYRKDSGEATMELFPVRRLRLDAIVDDFFFDQDYVSIISISCKGNGQVVDLDLGRKVADLTVSGKSHPGAAAIREKGKDTVLAVHSPGEGMINTIDINTWKPVTKIPAPAVIRVDHFVRPCNREGNQQPDHAAPDPAHEAYNRSKYH